MLAALLRKARCGPELLPLLAEPARAALQGLSILARRKQPQHIGAFLQVGCCWGGWGGCCCWWGCIWLQQLCAARVVCINTTLQHKPHQAAAASMSLLE
jgi:hypothetical protein